MVKDGNYRTILDKFVTAVEKSFDSGKESVEFSVYAGLDPDEMKWFVAVEIDNDESNTFCFTPEQATKMIPHFCYSIQFTNDKNYISFARMIAVNFAEALHSINTSKKAVGIIIRSNRYDDK
jgi:hypothetical protein